jgi:hypothetical protein
MHPGFSVLQHSLFPDPLIYHIPNQGAVVLYGLHHLLPFLCDLKPETSLQFSGQLYTQIHRDSHMCICSP